MSATQISFSDFALSVQQAATDCPPSVQQTAVVVVAHPLAADGGECSDCFCPGTWSERYQAYRAHRAGLSSLSNGSFVLLALANFAGALEDRTNSERMRSFDLLVVHAGHAIGAGC